jgi:hypothetical protein
MTWKRLAIGLALTAVTVAAFALASGADSWGFWR